MHIVLVDWKIRIGQEAAFVRFWGSNLHIANRTSMIGEFLSEINQLTDFFWINWDLISEGSPAEYTRYINVGIWSDAKAFEQEVSPYFDPAAGKLPFEFELRRRALLTPKAWRTGLAKLPFDDSYDVK